MKTTGFTRIIYGLLILVGAVLVGGMVYIGIQMARLPQPQQVTDAYLD